MSSSKHHNDKSELKHRHRSSVGNLAVGDVSPSLSTMNVTRSMRRKSDARLKDLTAESSTNSALLRKIYLSYIELCYKNSWIRPLIVLIFSYGMFFCSGEGTVIHEALKAMIVPSYEIEGSDQYGKGGKDFFFVGFYSIFFLFLREFLMSCLLRPLAVFFGLKKEGKIKRFMEQTYSIFYYGISGPFGLWIMSRLPLWYFETKPFYENYPHKTHDWYFKIYYLGQAAFWVQQSVVLILQLEKPRKDFKELVLHHIITIALIWCSYRFHFTWMGLEIYITMDISDFFLSFSKTINYLDLPYETPILAAFIFTWVYFRHYINLRILWSVLTEFRSIGDFELNWDTQQYKCWISQPIVFFLIGALQLVNLYWLMLIFRIAYRTLAHGIIKDDRSDDEDEDEDEDEDAENESLDEKNKNTQDNSINQGKKNI